MFVYVFSIRCFPVVNFKTVPYRNLPNSVNVVVTASAVVYVVFWCIPFFRGTYFIIIFISYIDFYVKIAVQ
jgi:hypothetical protein